MIDGQTNIFEMLYPTFKIEKPIRLIELFAGYGSQALALKYLGVPFEHWKICEWATKSIQAYKDIHFTNDFVQGGVLDIPKEQIISFLYEKGISSNYNEPMTLDQIKKIKESSLYNIYENIIVTNNLVNIQKVKGKDLEIVDTNKYCYIMTYSFPCQDLSLAGKGKGMSDTNTRSGMLWEVERILSECNDLKSLPQVLLMENVPQVHSSNNINDFNKWQLRLEQLGYKNYCEDLIATDYGIPQTRNRTFMVSILGDYNYVFPKSIPLKLKLKDMLEDQVDEKYYLSEKNMEYVCGNALNKDLKDMYNRENALFNRENAYCLNTKIDRRAGDSTYILDGYGETSVKDYLRIRNNNKKGYLEARDGDGVDISSRMEYHRGTVQKGKTQTLSCMGGENNGVVVNMYSESEKALFTENGNIKRYMGSDIIDQFEEGQMATTTYPNGYGHGPRTHNESVSLNTIDKPSVKHNLRIRKLTPNECFRLMGVKDEDFKKCAKNQSDSSLYHLAGDSIVVNVLMAIFNQMIDKE